jgi:hypothetical protein
MLVKFTADDGGEVGTQVPPLSLVAIAYGSEPPFVPTAIQVMIAGHATEFSCLPLGIEVGGAHEEPPLAVLSEMPPPEVAMPTAVQRLPDSQETPCRDVSAGCARTLHVLPSSWPMMVGSLSTVPMPMHVIAFGHDTPTSVLVPGGAI